MRSRQLARRQQASRFHHGSFAMHPPGFDRIEPGAFRRQLERQDAHPFACLFDEARLCSLIQVHTILLRWKAGIIPDQQPGVLPLRRQLLAAPLEKLSGAGASRTPGDKAQPHFVACGIIRLTLLPQHTSARQSGCRSGSPFFQEGGHTQDNVHWSFVSVPAR